MAPQPAAFRCETQGRPGGQKPDSRCTGDREDRRRRRRRIGAAAALERLAPDRGPGQAEPAAAKGARRAPQSRNPAPEAEATGGERPAVATAAAVLVLRRAAERQHGAANNVNRGASALFTGLRFPIRYKRRETAIPGIFWSLPQETGWRLGINRKSLFSGGLRRHFPQCCPWFSTMPPAAGRNDPAGPAAGCHRDRPRGGVPCGGSDRLNRRRLKARLFHRVGRCRKRRRKPQRQRRKRPPLPLSPSGRVRESQGRRKKWRFCAGLRRKRSAHDNPKVRA